MRILKNILWGLSTASIVSLCMLSPVSAAPTCQQACAADQQVCLKKAKTKPAQEQCNLAAKTCNIHCQHK